MNEGLSHGVTIGAYKLDSDGKLLELIGAALLLVVTKEYQEFAVSIIN